MSTESNDAMSVSFADPELERLRVSAKAWEDTAAVYARNDLDRQADIVQLRARLAEVEAEREAWRPVVEAAFEWKATGSNGGFDHLAASLHLLAAVDALPTRNLDSEVPNPSLTAETVDHG